jgi:hypothetical protein
MRGLTWDQVRKPLRTEADMKGSPGKHNDLQARGSVLARWLDHGLPEEAIEMLPDQRARLVGRPVKDLLLAPDTDLVVFDRLKGLYKEQIVLADTSAERDVATAMYYAVIACGLLCYGKKLSSYSYQELRRAFALLAKKRWMNVDLRGLFCRACRVCRDGHSRPRGCNHE